MIKRKSYIISSSQNSVNSGIACGKKINVFGDPVIHKFIGQ